MGATRPSDDEVFSFCPALFFVADRSGAFVRLSARLASRLGPEAREGTRLSDRVHPDDRPAFEAAWARLIESDGPARLDARLIGADGSHRHCVWHAQSAPSRGPVHGWLHEMTPEDLAAKDHATILRALEGQLPLVVWALDRQGNFTHHAGRALERAGLEQQQLIGKNAFALFPSDQMDPVRRAFKGQPGHSSAEQYGVTWEHWHVPVPDARGEITSVVGISLDVTDAKRTETTLKERLELIEQQQQIIRALSTPIIEVWDRVLALPMLGVVDTGRAAGVMDNLLAEVTRRQARFAVLDLTGVEVVDTGTASHLIKLVQALRLLGAEGIITGIQPTVAETMVALGLDLRGIVTLASLRDALTWCIEQLEDAVQ